MDERRPTQKEGVYARKVGEEWILYDTAEGSVHVVNATAERVWRLCDGAHNAAEMARVLRETYAVPEVSPVDRHVEAVLSQFVELGLVTFASP